MDLFKNQPGLALNKTKYDHQINQLKERNRHGIVGLDQKVAKLEPDLFKAGSNEMDVRILNSF